MPKGLGGVFGLIKKLKVKKAGSLAGRKVQRYFGLG